MLDKWVTQKKKIKPGYRKPSAIREKPHFILVTKIKDFKNSEFFKEIPKCRVIRQLFFLCHNPTFNFEHISAFS